MFIEQLMDIRAGEDLQHPYFTPHLLCPIGFLYIYQHLKNIKIVRFVRFGKLDLRKALSTINVGEMLLTSNIHSFSQTFIIQIWLFRKLQAAFFGWVLVRGCLYL